MTPNLIMIVLRCSGLKVVILANAGIQTFNQRDCGKSGFPRSRE
jgi:hypothetical protein